MPLYDYECSACRNRFEVKQSFSDDPIKVCPSCGGETKRVLHPPGIVFKGSGWYKTDSRSTPTESSSSSSSSSSGSSSSSSSGGSSSSSSSSSSSPSSGSSSGSSGSSSGGSGSSSSSS